MVEYEKEISMNNQKEQWDNSYQNRDNFLFYPNEEVIRFISKYIRKRIGFNDFKSICSYEETVKFLDLGCGIGRHIIYAHDMGLKTYGIDLSSNAIQLALGWANEKGITNPQERIIQGDIRNLPWSNGYFNCAISHGVLDSMHFEIAKDAIEELARVLTKGGLFYCDLISGDDSFHAREYSGEEIVGSLHEQGTVQSYFNYTKINQLIDDFFEIVECLLIKNENILTGTYTSRYHMVLRRK